MSYSYGKVAGALILIAVTQFVLSLIISEALYPGYSTSDNYISDLGVGPSSMIFNSSVFLMGLLLIIGAYFLHRAFNFTMLTVMLALTAIGAMGVGIFTEDAGTVHAVVSLIAFLFSGLSAIFAVICSHVHEFKLMNTPSSVISVAAGLTTLVALILFVSSNYLGLGPGGMERVIVYPSLMWGAGFGGYLMAHPEKPTTEKPQ